MHALFSLQYTGSIFTEPAMQTEHPLFLLRPSGHRGHVSKSVSGKWKWYQGSRRDLPVSHYLACRVYQPTNQTLKAEGRGKVAHDYLFQADSVPLPTLNWNWTCVDTKCVDTKYVNNGCLHAYNIHVCTCRSLHHYTLGLHVHFWGGYLYIII